MRTRTLLDIKTEIKKGEFYPAAIAALAIALSPDSHNPNFADLPYETDDDKLRPVRSVIDQWKVQMPDNMIPGYLDQLLKLRGLGIEYGLEDPFTHIPASTNRLVDLLTMNKVPFAFETYHGDHNSGIPARMATRILPFVADKLQFEPLVSSDPNGAGLSH